MVVEVFRFVVRLQDHNLVRILEALIELVAQIARLTSRGSRHLGQQPKNLIRCVRLTVVFRDYLKQELSLEQSAH